MSVCCAPHETNIRPFVKHLLGMDKRIRVYPLFGDKVRGKGFFITKDCISVPYVLPKVEHDVAHVVELTNMSRLTIPDWGMPRFESDYIPPAAFFAALSREVRTRALQLHIQPECYGVETSTTWNQFANPYWKNMCEKLLPFGRFKTFQDVCTWMGDLRERTYRKWSADRIEHEWKVRLAHIQQWMETLAE